MSDYRNNPNTKRLATYCCVCGLPLCDSKSVEIGIGPTCRKKHGFDAIYKGLTDGQRKTVNKLIHKAGVACEDDNLADVLAIADKIEKRGFNLVADKVRTRFVKIRILRATVPEYGWTRQNGEFPTGNDHSVVQVWTPYSQAFNANRRDSSLRGRPCKVTTDHGRFHWEFKTEHSVLLLRVLAMTFPGTAYLSDKGISVVPTPEEFNRQFAGCDVRAIPVR